MQSIELLKQELKKLIITSLNLQNTTEEDIKDNEPLFREGLGLDSIDALELAVALEKKYNIKFDDEKIARQSFQSIDTLSSFIQNKNQA
ncbi:MAG: acyl carrier protein [Candidatus Brocadiae bacterium]|nr:acyl carrier protein [Candidatus Brocadiia bacterium]